MLASVASIAQAADECRVAIRHNADGGARAPMVTTVTLSVGDVVRPPLDWLEALRNDGPHDVRVSLVGAPARLLLRGQSEPSLGRFERRVALSQIECLATRSASRQTPRPLQPGDRLFVAATRLAGGSR